ncbi:DUF397 domain-containing protein [Streptomyces albireticuli]|uniref:DUF397 domain-containing protein n=1 Tax=Streptomyces albireticuli TaxID=1940 RepID=UPI0036A2FB7F
MQEAPSGIPGEGWFKSSHSGAGHTECIEVAHAAPHTFIRDSKGAGWPVLVVTRTAWSEFVGGIRCGSLA